VITCERHTAIGQKTTNYKHLALSTAKSKSKVCRGLASTVHFIVAMENTEQIHGTMCFTNYDKK